MRAFDASSALYAWDNYPIAKFPGLWQWLGGEVARQRIRFCSVAFTEVLHKNAACHQWFVSSGVVPIHICNASVQFAVTVKNSIGVAGNGYHPDGVGENDVLIISSARINGLQLVSNEKVQIKLPALMARYKIPAVCDLAHVSVPCIDFLGVIKSTTATF